MDDVDGCETHCRSAAHGTVDRPECFGLIQMACQFPSLNLLDGHEWNSRRAHKCILHRRNEIEDWQIDAHVSTHEWLIETTWLNLDLDLRGFLRALARAHPKH